MDNNAIIFTTDDGEEVTFNVLEQTTLGGVNYLLVAEDTDDEEDEEDGSFLILKEDREDGGDDMVEFSVVEEEGELQAVAKIFNELLDDLDLEV